MLNVVYFSQVTETTHRFVKKLQVPGDTLRIPLRGDWEYGNAAPYILAVPTYGDSKGARLVPHQVIRFLNDAANRAGCVGVISFGNRNFGRDFARAGRVIADKLNVPLLHIIELAGDVEDVVEVQTIVDALAQQAERIEDDEIATIVRERSSMESEPLSAVAARFGIQA
jgi:protein involved in ribonucleotide reduction